MLLFYIRHGEPVYEPNGLTPLGARQAEAVAKRLAAHGLDEIYASSSKRAVDTARPTSELTHKPIVELDWCDEDVIWQELAVKYPDGTKDWLYRDKAACEMFVSDEVYALGDKWYTHKAFSEPRYKSGMERVTRHTREFIKSLGYEYDEMSRTYNAVAPNDRRVALFAHEGFGKAFLSVVTGIPYPVFCTRFEIEHSGVTAIRLDGERHVIPQILQHSNDSHLFKDGLPTRYNNEILF